MYRPMYAAGRCVSVTPKIPVHFLFTHLPSEIHKSLSLVRDLGKTAYVTTRAQTAASIRQYQISLNP
jgi:hypothetical protein